MLYRVVLERAPDAGGLAYWIAYAGGREAVAAGFADSAELAAKSRSAMVAAIPTLLATHNDTIVGGAGNDTLDGGLGADTYLFDQAAGSGSDTVLRFDAWDRVNLKGFNYANKADVLTHLSQQGSDVVFADQGQTITFVATQLATVQQAEWLLQ